jgi:hypothetical protein
MSAVREVAGFRKAVRTVCSIRKAAVPPTRLELPPFTQLKRSETGIATAQSGMSTAYSSP